MVSSRPMNPIAIDNTWQNRRAPRLRFRALRWLAQYLPKRAITVYGKPYLDRYYIAGPIGEDTRALWPADDRPRPRLAWLLRRTWYLHRFHRADAALHLHDHPWDGRGRVLAGGYQERQLTPAGVDTRLVVEGERTHVEPGKYHTIHRLIRVQYGDPRGECWTLLRCTLPHSSGWGYYIDTPRGPEHMSHVNYHESFGVK